MNPRQETLWVGSGSTAHADDTACILRAKNTCGDWVCSCQETSEEGVFHFKSQVLSQVWHCLMPVAESRLYCCQSGFQHDRKVHVRRPP